MPPPLIARRWQQCFFMKGVKTNKRIRERLFVCLSSFVLFGATYYGHQITSQRVEVLEHGILMTSEVTKTASKRTNKSFYVVIDNVERDGGEYFGKYKDINEGDRVQVRYIRDVKYVVAEGVTNFRNMLIFQNIIFVLSAILFFLPILPDFK